jgi:hypothetical protein
MFRVGYETAKSKMTRKSIKNPTLKTTSKLFRPIMYISHEMFLLNMVLVGIKTIPLSMQA